MSARAPDILPKVSSPLPKKPTKRQELGARSRDEILNAALRIMSIYGYEGASIARIASESGLPSSSIYWHFGSKSGVLSAVMQRGADRFFSESGNFVDLERNSVPPRQLLRDTLRNSARSVDANPEFLRLLFLLTLSGEHDEAIQNVVRETTHRGMSQLRGLIKFVYSEHGEARAEAIADRLQVFAQSVFDGAFLASQTHDGVRHVDLIDFMVDSVLALGDALVIESA